MSDQQNRDGGDPSMEEILASIRKIISEEGEGGAREGRVPKPGDEASPADDTSAAHESPEHESPEHDEFARAADDDAAPAPEAAAASFPTASAPEEEILDLTEEVEADADSPDEAGSPLSWDVAADEETRETTAEAGEPEPAETSDADDLQAAEAGTAAVEPPEQEDSSPMTSDSGGIETRTRDSVMSEETSTAATSALTELARAANARDFGEGKPKSDADRILEELVREALRPQLKAWLDENLPGLVERVVREEIRRMSQRAELSAESERED
jgi:cell pole-organizing protein PopZ